MINKRHIAWFILLLLFSQQSLATVRSIIMMTQSSLHYTSQYHSVMQSMDCNNHQDQQGVQGQHHNQHQGHTGQHCQQASNDSHHSHHAHHCEHCISGCHSLLFVCSELYRVDIRSVNASIRYFSFIPSAPINNLFRPPITA